MRRASVELNVAADDGACETASFAQHRAERLAGNVVEGIDTVGAEGIEDARLQQLSGPFARLFGGLEKQDGTSLFQRVQMQLLGQSQQDGGMTVVPALVGYAGSVGSVGDVDGFVHPHGVKVGAEEGGGAVVAAVENGKEVVAVAEGADFGRLEGSECVQQEPLGAYLAA